MRRGRGSRTVNVTVGFDGLDVSEVFGTPTQAYGSLNVTARCSEESPGYWECVSATPVSIEDLQINDDESPELTDDQRTALLALLDDRLSEQIARAAEREAYEADEAAYEATSLARADW